MHQTNGYSSGSQLGEETCLSPRNTEILANCIVGYIFIRYGHSRHVRRVATWVGLILKGIERIAGGSLRRRGKGQVKFQYQERHFKVKFNHKAGPRGGLDILEIRGIRNGALAARITSLEEAEGLYRCVGRLLNSFIETHPEESSDAN